MKRGSVEVGAGTVSAGRTAPPDDPMEFAPVKRFTSRSCVDNDDLAARAVEFLDCGPAGTLTVVINDPQRHTDSRPVLEALARLVRPEGIRVLVATGTHRFEASRRAAFERRFLGGLEVGRVDWHDARRDDLVPVDGRWRAHPWIAGRESVLAVGSVEPHYFAGFTGAHKTATIGVASRADIERNHETALDPACRPGRLDGNPVYEGVLRMLASCGTQARLAGINFVQVDGETVFGDVAAGRPIEAFDASLRRAAAIARECFMHELDAPADALIVEVEGPLAETFYQADKGIKNNEWAVRDGGAIILLASCAGGIGQDAFMELLRQASDHAAAAERVRRRGYRLGDHKAVRLRYLTDPSCRAVRVHAVCPGLSPEESDVLGFLRAASVEAALDAAGVRPGRDRVWRVRDAGNACVTVRGG